MEEYQLIYPKPEIDSREQRDVHHDKLEEMIQELLDEQQRAFKELKVIEGN